MVEYFMSGGLGMWLVGLFVLISLTLSTVQLVGVKRELRGFVWMAVGMVPVVAVLWFSIELGQILAAYQVVPEADRDNLLAQGLSLSVYPLHWALLCGLVTIPFAAFAVTRRRWRTS